MLLVLGFGWANGPEGGCSELSRGQVPWNPSEPENRTHQVHIELPLEVRAHLVLHPVDLPKGEYPLAENSPGFVRVGFIAYDLERNHKQRDEEVVSGGTVSSNKPRLQPLQEVESSKGHGECEPCV